MVEAFAFIQEPLSKIDWYREGGLGAVALILLIVAGWFLKMYLSERKRLEDANKEHAKDYKELLKNALLSEHQSNEALDKMRRALDVIGRLETIKSDVNYLRNRGDDN